MIDPQALLDAIERGFRPLPGRCVIEMDSVPSMIGSLHVPESAQEMRLLKETDGKSVFGDSSYTGKVVAVTSRRSDTTGEFIPEDFCTGDKVLVMLLVEDMNQKIIVTRNTRVYAVIED